MIRQFFPSLRPYPNIRDDLDPLAPRIRAIIGLLLYIARRYEEALEELKKALEFDPSHCMSYLYLGIVYIELNKYQEALEFNMKFVECEEGASGSYIFLALAYTRAGKTEDARKILGELSERSKKEYVSPARVAAVYGALGEYDIAFDLLNKAYAERDNKMIQLNTNSIYDPLRSDPRFSALLKKIGLEK